MQAVMRPKSQELIKNMQESWQNEISAAISLRQKGFESIDGLKVTLKNGVHSKTFKDANGVSYECRSKNGKTIDKILVDKKSPNEKSYEVSFYRLYNAEPKLDIYSKDGHIVFAMDKPEPKLIQYTWFYKHGASEELTQIYYKGNGYYVSYSGNPELKTSQNTFFVEL